MATAALGGAPAAAAARRRTAPTGAALLPLGAARGAALLALATFGGLHWMQMLEPPAPGRAAEAVGIAALAAVLLGVAGRVQRPGLRWAAAAAVALAVIGLALLAGGVADEDLRPDRWDALVAGIARGVEALPGVRVPYRGVDEWTRTVIGAGGTVLAAAAALLAFWPRRRGRTGYPVPALGLLVVLYVVPSVALIFDAEALRGALLVLLLIAFLRLERLRAHDARAAGVAAGAAVLLALAIGPALDRPAPWWDYETWALSAASAKTTTFSWDHDDRPLDWPRDGRELLRVRAKRDAYWKAENLDAFERGSWRRSFYTGADLTQMPDHNADPGAADKWTERIRVSVRNLESREVITAGVALDVDLGTRGSTTVAPGIEVPSGRPLRRGDAYSAEVYVPEPTEAQLRTAGTDYEFWLSDYWSIGLPDAPRFDADGDRIRFPPFGTGGRPKLVNRRYVRDARPAGAAITASGLDRTWALAQRLREQASTPYGYVRQVEAYLRQSEFTYTETPPRSAETLEGFLFDAKAGFCQQYSGAMALLLRMGGVPARVAAGFSAGSLDRKTNEYVVRDLDAHSWVEAWFPGYGWVTFDPTPSAAPPRSQSAIASLANAPSFSSGDRPDIGVSRGVNSRRSIAQQDGGVPWPLVAIGVLAAALLGLALVRWRRGRAHGAIPELEVALRRAGWTAPPGTTLQALERLVAGNPAAAGYLQALRAERYGAAAARPTPAQRRGLRAELGRGGGVSGRVRAWWALPPRVTSPGRRRPR